MYLFLSYHGVLGLTACKQLGVFGNWVYNDSDEFPFLDNGFATSDYRKLFGFGQFGRVYSR